MNWHRPDTRSPSIVICLIVFVLAVSAPAAQAQFNRLERSRYSRAAYYSYAEPDEVTIEVPVWGSVRHPGLYEIPTGTRLSELFSLTGGPSTGVQRFDQDQTLTVRLTRKKGDRRVVVFEEIMEDEVLAFDENPVVRPNDILVVERYVDPTFTYRDLFPIIGAASSVVTTLVVIFAN